MKYKETTTEQIAGFSITREKERTFYALISIDIHTSVKNIHKEALMHVYTDALLAGCDTYSRDAFLDAVNLLGASITVSINNDVLSFGLQCLDTHRAKLLTLFFKMLEKPTFAPSEIKRVALVLSNELEEDMEDAKMRSLVGFVNTLYKSSDRRYASLGAPLIAEIRSITKADLKRFHAEVLGKKWIYTLCANARDASTTVAAFTKLRMHFADTSTHLKGPDVQTIKKSMVTTISIPSKQNIELSIGAPVALTLDAPLYHAFVFGLNVLGKWGGFTGRLMSTVREKEGLTYGIYARTETISRSYTGHWRIMTFFSPEKVMQGIQSTLREIKLIQQKGISKDEFERFMSINKTQETLLQDSIIQNVNQIHSFLLKGFTYDEISLFKEKSRSVTQKQVNKALREYLDVSNLVICAAGPTRSKEKELRALFNLANAVK